MLRDEGAGAALGFDHFARAHFHRDFVTGGRCTVIAGHRREIEPLMRFDEIGKAAGDAAVIEANLVDTADTTGIKIQKHKLIPRYTKPMESGRRLRIMREIVNG